MIDKVCCCPAEAQEVLTASVYLDEISNAQEPEYNDADSAGVQSELYKLHESLHAAAAEHESSKESDGELRFGGLFNEDDGLEAAINLIIVQADTTGQSRGNSQVGTGVDAVIDVTANSTGAIDPHEVVTLFQVRSGPKLHIMSQRRRRALSRSV